MTDTRRAALEANRRNWDLLTGVHLDSDFYDVDSFLAGATTLKRPELDLAGPVDGLRLLHLQCHFGLDTLSWARLGAAATGVDFSARTIEAARELARRSGTDAEFIQSDVQRLPAFDAPYDLVVTTYGALCWLGGLREWADGVRRSLRPGGRLLVVDFHPMQEALHPGKMTGAQGYFGSGRPYATWTEGSYAKPGAPIRYEEFRWQHTLADVVGAALDAGLTLTGLQEYPYCSYGLFDELAEGSDGLWRPADGVARHPYMFSISAGRPE